MVDLTWFSTVANQLDVNRCRSYILGYQVDIASSFTCVDNYSSSIAREYHSRFGDKLCFHEAKVYDSYIVLGLSVLEASSMNVNNVREVLPGVAEDFVSLTGSCGLDTYGDSLDF